MLNVLQDLLAEDSEAMEENSSPPEIREEPDSHLFWCWEAGGIDLKLYPHLRLVSYMDFNISLSSVVWRLSPNGLRSFIDRMDRLTVHNYDFRRLKKINFLTDAAAFAAATKAAGDLDVTHLIKRRNRFAYTKYQQWHITDPASGNVAEVSIRTGGQTALVQLYNSAKGSSVTSETEDPGAVRRFRNIVAEADHRSQVA
jgi:hypothetical protein